MKLGVDLVEKLKRRQYIVDFKKISNLREQLKDVDIQQNKYEVLTLPVDYETSFLVLTGIEIRNYFKWFQEVKKSRLDQLCIFLFKDPGKCLSEDSLRVIEEFLRNSITVLPKSSRQYKVEAQKVPRRLKQYAKPKDYVFSDKTISICFDIGIFMGELIISLDNKITWALEEDDRFADYGQPVLRKKGCKFEINPFMVAKNAAAKIHEGRYEDGQIGSFLQAWKKGFNI